MSKNLLFIMMASLIVITACMHKSKLSNKNKQIAPQTSHPQGREENNFLLHGSFIESKKSPKNILENLTPETEYILIIKRSTTEEFEKANASLTQLQLVPVLSKLPAEAIANLERAQQRKMLGFIDPKYLPEYRELLTKYKDSYDNSLKKASSSLDSAQVLFIPRIKNIMSDLQIEIYKLNLKTKFFRSAEENIQLTRLTDLRAQLQAWISQPWSTISVKDIRKQLNLYKQLSGEDFNDAGFTQIFSDLEHLAAKSEKVDFTLKDLETNQGKVRLAPYLSSEELTTYRGMTVEIDPKIERQVAEFEKKWREDQGQDYLATFEESYQKEVQARVASLRGSIAASVKELGETLFASGISAPALFRPSATKGNLETSIIGHTHAKGDTIFVSTSTDQKIAETFATVKGKGDGSEVQLSTAGILLQIRIKRGEGADLRAISKFSEEEIIVPTHIRPEDIVGYFPVSRQFINEIEGTDGKVLSTLGDFVPNPNFKP